MIGLGGGGIQCRRPIFEGYRTCSFARPNCSPSREHTDGVAFVVMRARRVSALGYEADIPSAENFRPLSAISGHRYILARLT